MKKTKRHFALALALIMALGVVLPATAFANEISVTVNGEVVVFDGQGPAIVDGRTLVPVRGVFEQLGFDVEWNQEEQVATLINEEWTVTIYVGALSFGLWDNSADLETDGQTWQLDVPAQIINGRTMLPIRTVLESVGYYVGWDAATQTVLVSTEPIEEPAAENQGINWQHRADIAISWLTTTRGELRALSGGTFDPSDQVSGGDIYDFPGMNGVRLLFSWDHPDENHMALSITIPLFTFLDIETASLEELQAIFGEGFVIDSAEGFDEYMMEDFSFTWGEITINGYEFIFNADENDVVTHVSVLNLRGVNE